jgi:hypothetical protein
MNSWHSTIFFLLLSSIFSCTQKIETIDQFGKYAFDKLLSEDDVMDLFFHISDSSYITDQYQRDIIESYKDTIEYNKDLQGFKYSVDDWREQAKKMNISKSNVKYLRSEKVIHDYGDDARPDVLIVYFLFEDKEHFFKLYVPLKLKNKWVVLLLSPPTNEELAYEERLSEASAPNTPYDIKFSDVSWEYRYSDPRTFSKFFLTVENQTDYDYKRLKFKLTIYDSKEEPRNVIFSKTIEKKEMLSSGDVVRFEIYELRDFFVDVNLNKKHSFGWSAKLIDAKPRPGYEDLYVE